MKPSSTLKIPTKIDVVLESAAGSSQDPLSSFEEGPDAYTSSIVSYLQEQLQLPDVGEVMIQLTIAVDGKVEKMKILSSESIKNRKRLEENLPRLQFPAPGSKKWNSSKTFIITFCNQA